MEDLEDLEVLEADAVAAAEISSLLDYLNEMRIENPSVPRGFFVSRPFSRQPTLISSAKM